MSHVATIELEINDLGVLRKAAERIGLEFVEDKRSYKWWGYSEGDYPLPEGFSKEDLGKCDHALRIPNNGKAYEIGVVKARDGKKGYTLLWDFYDGGYGLEAVVGTNAGLLKQAYSIERAKKQAYMDGFQVTEIQKPNGNIVLEAYQ